MDYLIMERITIFAQQNVILGHIPMRVLDWGVNFKTKFKSIFYE